jgi:cell wall-associated NlpC family hydrolase
MKLLKKMLSATLAVFLLFSAAPLSAMAADPGNQKTGVAFITASSLRLRSAPSTSSATLAYATTGEVTVLLGRSGDWYHVLYNLQEGYMHSSHLNTTAVENVELGYGKVNYTKVNMRTGPGTSYSSIGQSSKNDLCYIVGINKQWYKVIWNDQICYIRSDYLDLTEMPYENKASRKSPLFFRGGKSTGTPVSATTLKNSSNYIAPNGSAKATAIIATAKKYIGVPYVWGGSTPSGFDCSGLVQYVFKQHGITLNRTTKTQYQHGTFVAKINLQPGDLVFFQNTYTTGISHVGIYIGSGEFIHASSSQGVTISSLSNSYWSSHYYGARRVL